MATTEPDSQAPAPPNPALAAQAAILAQAATPVRRMADAIRVLAIDASAHEDRAPEGARRYRDGDLRKRALTAPDAALADVLLHPDFGYWVSLTEAFRRRAIDAGYTATLAAAPTLRALHRA